jgi:hypothetical protein
MIKKQIILYLKPQIILKGLLFLKNINILVTKSIKMQKTQNKTLTLKKLKARRRVSTKRWVYLQTTLPQQLGKILKIFKTTWKLCELMLGIQKAEIKVKSKKDNLSEQQFNEFPAIILLMSRTFEQLNNKSRGLLKFSQELFIKNKIAKVWVKKYKSITYVCKTIFFGESFVTNFFLTLGKLLLKFPRISFRKTKILNCQTIMLNLLNFWTWSILDKIQVNQNNLGLKNIYIEPLNINTAITTKHNKNIIWNLWFFLRGLSLQLNLKRAKVLIQRYLFFWYMIKSKIVNLPTRFSAIFSKKIQKNKIIKRRKKTYINVFKKYANFISLIARVQFKNKTSNWQFFKRIRLLLNKHNKYNNY